MSKISRNIPVNSLTDDFSKGISIDRLHLKKSDLITAKQYEEATQSHRDEGHTFHIVEKGNVFIEIDFKKYKIAAPSVVYMHPDQVHRILKFKEITVCTLAIKNENLNPGYLTLLEEVASAKPMALKKDIYTNIHRTFLLCLNVSTQKSNRLHHVLLNDACNTLVGLLASELLNQSRYSGKVSRFELITKNFKQLLEENYRTIKRPADYARLLNLSVPYLNESIKQVTGLPASKYIQDRIILEAKRLLYHTKKSVKEIAFDLGYEDYPYFSRLFTKAAGMSALAFRNKNHD